MLFNTCFLFLRFLFSYYKMSDQFQPICSSNSKYNYNEEEMNYSTYLELNKLLTSQKMKSEENKHPAHHEHLFIITHQVYELWFKQIIFELDSCINKLLINKNEILENSSEIIKRLSRVVRIMRHVLEQLPILETMTPSDFMEFRCYLSSASGFQSLQFRLIENKIGLKDENRVLHQQGYLKQFSNNILASNKLKESQEKNLLKWLEEWLEYWPSKNVDIPVFKEYYKNGIEKYVSETRQKNDTKKRKIPYDLLFDSQAYYGSRCRKISHDAFLGGVIVTLYLNQPIFTTTHHIINLMLDMDSTLAKWRHSHMLMVQRMIGIDNHGTGGSSGCEYLKSTLGDEYSIFGDLANISKYIIPQRYVPSFNYVQNARK